jgi:hypothetical protein
MGRVHITGYGVPTLAMPGPDIAFEEACFRTYEWSKFASYGRVSHRANNATWIKCSRCAETNGMDPDARNLTHNPLTGRPLVMTAHAPCAGAWRLGAWAMPGQERIGTMSDVSPEALAQAKAMGLIPDDETPEEKASREERLAKMRAHCVELVAKHGLTVVAPGPESLKMRRDWIEAEKKKQKL